MEECIHDAAGAGFNSSNSPPSSSFSSSHSSSVLILRLLSSPLLLYPPSSIYPSFSPLEFVTTPLFPSLFPFVVPFLKPQYRRHLMHASHPRRRDAIAREIPAWRGQCNSMGPTGLYYSTVVARPWTGILEGIPFPLVYVDRIVILYRMQLLIWFFGGSLHACDPRGHTSTPPH